MTHRSIAWVIRSLLRLTLSLPYFQIGEIASKNIAQTIKCITFPDYCGYFTDDVFFIYIWRSIYSTYSFYSHASALLELWQDNLAASRRKGDTENTRDDESVVIHGARRMSMRIYKFIQSLVNAHIQASMNSGRNVLAFDNSKLCLQYHDITQELQYC